MEESLFYGVETQEFGDENAGKSAENFQKFIYGLFEKNGVLNDLRAYLRGHIINILKTAETGELPSCQMHFTQRLEHTFQALNILIAEYLLCLDFSYSLSIFLSEIPLANMVFDYAKALLKLDPDSNSTLRFRDKDVWSVLNYLGIKCDSTHASNIAEMYMRDGRTPLLLCILKCMPMYKKEDIDSDKVSVSEDSSSTIKSTETLNLKSRKKNRERNSKHDKCRHYLVCKTCRKRMLKLQEKYKKKKKVLIENMNEYNENSLNFKSFMKDVGNIEQSLINEMFEQLKNVYEVEVEMVKKEEHNYIKRTLANYDSQFQKQRDEMEEEFRSRELELERNIQQKKKFLWDLAKSLRNQHEQMSRAMLAVRQETDRLTNKEQNLKSQMTEAEKVLKQRGEEMRVQISNELLVLESNFESMKKERDDINRERSELENLKASPKSSTNLIEINEVKDELRSHYDLLKNELQMLKAFVESSKMAPKSFIERSTITELRNVTSKINILLNNEHGVEKNLKSDDKVDVKTLNQVVNDLKKQKMVNFCQPNLSDLYKERGRSSVPSEGNQIVDRDTDQIVGRDYIVGHNTDFNQEFVERLREENERLRNLARQQGESIAELSSQQARLQAQLWSTHRPRAAPSVLPLHLNVGQAMNSSTSASNFGWRKGGGEELNLFTTAQPRIMVPGDTLPFVGVLNRRYEHRRHLVNQWRLLRRRLSPLGVSVKPRTSSPRERTTRERPVSAGPVISTQPESRAQDDGQTSGQTTENARSNCHQPKKSHETKKSREKSPGTVLREAKGKLKNSSKESSKIYPLKLREKSPTAVLREAKLRLRKLEIEAEAVEQSYLDFKKRRENINRLSEDRISPVVDTGHLVTKNSSISLQKLDEDRNRSKELFLPVQDIPMVKEARTMIKDFDKYLRDYQKICNLRPDHDKRPSDDKELSILSRENNIPKDNYLEKPLTEFRKLYHSDKPKKRSKSMKISQESRLKSPKVTNVVVENFVIDEKTIVNDRPESTQSVTCIEVNKYATVDNIDKTKDSARNVQLEILKNNIRKIFNIKGDSDLKPPHKESNKGDSIENKEVKNVQDNLLTIEIENVSENKLIPVQTKNENQQEDIILFVESSVDENQMAKSDSDNFSEQTPIIMTLVVSPKKNGEEIEKIIKENNPKENESLEQVNNDVLEVILKEQDQEKNSVKLELLGSKQNTEDSVSELEKVQNDYPDDFSADVDNYNSRSDYDHSPISLLKSSEDEIFWD